MRSVASVPSETRSTSPKPCWPRGYTHSRYGVGQRRDQVTGLPGGPWIATATHRFGLTDGVTLGGQGDATADLLSGGPQVGWLCPGESSR